jgi:hypothetical protein
MELPGGLVLAIAGTSSAKTIPSPLETFVILSILLNNFEGMICPYKFKCQLI